MSGVRFAERIDGSGHHPEPRKEMGETASAKPTGTELFPGATCSGHIDLRSERVGDRFAVVIKLMAIKVRFLRHVGDHQNPVDFANLVASILTS